MSSDQPTSHDEAAPRGRASRMHQLQVTATLLTRTPPLTRMAARL